MPILTIILSVFCLRSKLIDPFIKYKPMDRLQQIPIESSEQIPWRKEHGLHNTRDVVFGRSGLKLQKDLTDGMPVT
jgi:hypothetical protein